MPPRLLLLDTASLYFRAFFGVPATLKAPDGRPINAVRGLLDILARFVADRSPTHVACAWDNDWRPAWRVELLPEYKAHRVAESRQTELVGAAGKGALSGVAEAAPEELAAQVILIREVLEAIGIPIVGADGYEADDVLGTLSLRGAADIVTGDRDLFQLVSPEVNVLYVARGISNYEVATPDWVAQKYGILPEQYVDFSVLRGDPSDGLPGVQGIGEKTAAELLARHGDLEGILAARAGLSPRVAANLEAAIDYLAAAREVVAVRRDLALGPLDLTLPTAPVDRERFANLTAELGLGGSAARLLEALAQRAVRT